MGYHWVVARTQTIVQLTDELLTELDARRAREGRSRSELIRDAIEAYLAVDREDRARPSGRRRGYTRVPPDEFGSGWAVRASIEAESWPRAEP